MLHKDLMCDEFVNIINKGQWVLLPAHLDLDEKNLNLSPSGVIPQRDRRPHNICDYPFFFVNIDTTPLSPQECMQFGRDLWRMLHQVTDADLRLGPVYLSKIDIMDGFYRICIHSENMPTLGIMFPTSDGEPQLVGFPIVMPMGWMQ
jgi:hypothetical protein